MPSIIEKLAKQIYPSLAPSISELLDKTPDNVLEPVNEIRLRVNQPVTLVLPDADVWLGPQGKPVLRPSDAYICSKEDMSRCLQIMSRHSLYALEKELRQGFLTLPGGHRVGLAGQAVIENDKVKTLTNISSLNIRIAREVKGCADLVMPFLFKEGQLTNTLVISPPRYGKTTLLRDIARQLSSGIPALRYAGAQVGLVDERSEIAACMDGVPSMDLGGRIDVLDGCPKACGMLMLIRSMSPEVIITDELGRQEDAEAMQEAVHAGVPVIASVHGRSVEDIANRPYIGSLVTNGWFERFIILARKPSPGAIEEVISGIRPGELLYRRNKDVKVCG